MNWVYNSSIINEISVFSMNKKKKTENSGERQYPLYTRTILDFKLPVFGEVLKISCSLYKVLPSVSPSRSV